MALVDLSTRSGRCQLRKSFARLNKFFRWSAAPLILTLFLLGGAACRTATSASRGFVNRIFVDGSGVKHRYIVFVPHESQPGQRLPVLLFLNGAGENGRDGVRQISNNFGLQIWEMEPWFPFLAVMPQMNERGNWSGRTQDAQWVLQILDEAIHEFGGDPDRVCLTGVSSGGSGTWQIGSAFADRFAALIPLCGSSLPKSESLVEAKMPIWNFYNDKDRADLVEINRKIRASLIESGLSPLITEYDARGHDCWNQAWRCLALYRWILQQNRQGNRLSSLFTFQSPETIVADWKKVATGDWNANGDSLHGKAGSSEASLVSNFSSAGMEFHADFQLPKSGFLLDVMESVGESQPRSVLRITVPRGDKGSGGIVNLRSQDWLCELDPAAQHWLRADWWNEIRLNIADGRITVWLNGWQAADVTLSSPSAELVAGATPRYHIGLVAGAQGDLAMRYLRHRLRPDPRPEMMERQ